ncbi:MAG: AMP-binding protein, partial [Acidimicrobiales bacterium]|nr:AMP-binding protein [Acidimicrobiales bacterium]
MRVHDGLEYYARTQPDLVFASQGGRSLTFAEADVAANRFARALRASGVERGTRFAWLGKNSIDMAVMFCAGSKLGAVPVPLNYRLAPPELRVIIDDARCPVVLADGDLVAVAEAARSVEPTDGAPDPVTHWVAVQAAPPTGWHALDSWLALAGAGEDAAGAGVDLDADVLDTDILYQMYTSGTTGRPKGVLLSHRNVLQNIEQIFGASRYRPRLGDKTLVAAPMYHASGGLSVIAAATRGLSLEIHADFDPAAVVDALSDGGVNFCTLVPVMIQLCLAVPGAAERDYSSLQLITYGAAPIGEALMRQAVSVFGCELGQGFGQTEATSCITFLTQRDHDLAVAGRPELLASVGRPLPGTRLAVLDDDDRPLGPREVGEIVAAGPQVMSGYWNAPDQSAATLRGGWLHTGDVGYVDEEGYVYLVDRKKDMIVTGGSNVYSVEVEKAVEDHPSVREVAVIGVPDERWGET